jgi:SWI/SNF-related matrix-associated actin-dependent regulator of chromatin subfamily E protein 1
LQPPEAPVKPLTPYMRLYGKVVNEVKAANQTLGGQSNPKEIHQIIRKKWEELCDIDKEGFTKETETEMVEYERNLKAYHDSPAYQVINFKDTYN